MKGLRNLVLPVVLGVGMAFSSPADKFLNSVIPSWYDVFMEGGPLSALVPPVPPRIISQEVLPEVFINRYRMVAQIYSGDTNHYCVMCSTNLMAGFFVSDVNTNIYSATGRGAQVPFAELFNEGVQFFKLESVD